MFARVCGPSSLVDDGRCQHQHRQANERTSWKHQATSQRHSLQTGSRTHVTAISAVSRTSHSLLGCLLDTRQVRIFIISGCIKLKTASSVPVPTRWYRYGNVSGVALGRREMW